MMAAILIIAAVAHVPQCCIVTPTLVCRNPMQFDASYHALPQRLMNTGPRFSKAAPRSWGWPRCERARA